MRPLTVFSPRPRAARRGRRIPRRALAGLAAGVLGAAVAVPLRYALPRRDRPPAATLVITSIPSGAEVLVDGVTRGPTPIRLAIDSGTRRVALHHPTAIDWIQTVQVTPGQERQLAATLWRRTPRVESLRPPFPGVSIADAALLADGRVALHVVLPPGDDHQLWLRRTDGSLKPLGPAVAPGPLAAAPDGQTVAALTPNEGLGARRGSGSERRLTSLWTTRADGSGLRRRYSVPATEGDTELVDLAWSPDSANLLLAAARRPPEGGTRTELLQLDVQSGRADSLIELPSEIVAGSLQWSPGGTQVALLTQANGLASLCFLEVRSREFRYLADLQHGATALPFVPLAWTPDGQRAVYAAPVPARAHTLGALLFGSSSATGLFLLAGSAPQGRRLGTLEAAWPVWLPSGQILAISSLAGPSGSVLATTDPAGSPLRRQGLLPLPASLSGLRWHPAQARAIAAVPSNDGGWDYVLLTFAPEVA